jgi:membrane protease YdiL (CAAX protease family)
MSNYTHSKTAEASDQYSLAKILGIWAAAALPMAILSWIIFPLLAPDFETDPLGSSVMRVVLLTLGLIWLFILSMIIVRQEEGDLRWTTIKQRLRLNPPLDPKTGQKRYRLWLWIVPALIGIALIDAVLASTIDNLWVSVFPFFAEPPGFNFATILDSPVIMERLVGAWWFLALFLVFAIFNTILGEEFLFRGVLLPKMEGVFGRWSWVANGVLFGFFHLHQPWGILSAMIGGALFFALPAWRFRSTWMSIIVQERFKEDK